MNSDKYDYLGALKRSRTHLGNRFSVLFRQSKDSGEGLTGPSKKSTLVQPGLPAIGGLFLPT